MAALAAVFLVLWALASPGRAVIVSYEWVPQAGSGGSGFMTLDSVLISDPANFSGVDFASLAVLDYTFGNGIGIQKSDIQFFQGFPFSAAAGQLTNNFQFSTNTVALSFSLASNAGISSNQTRRRDRRLPMRVTGVWPRRLPQCLFRARFRCLPSACGPSSERRFAGSPLLRDPVSESRGNRDFGWQAHSTARRIFAAVDTSSHCLQEKIVRRDYSRRTSQWWFSSFPGNRVFSSSPLNKK